MKPASPCREGQPGSELSRTLTPPAARLGYASSSSTRPSLRSGAVGSANLRFASEANGPASGRGGQGEERLLMATFRCDIVSAEEEIFHGEAELLVATGEMGELGIAPRHAPLITRLKPGKVVVTLPGGEKLDFAVSGGILEVQPQVVTVLTDTAVRAEDIDEAAVRAAKEEAERILAGRGEAMEVAEAQAKLAEVQAQLQALERLRKNLKH
jgi:F-type H+-transporting ATPase subunit epsilon